MANIPGQILFQTNNDAWFTTNAAIVFDDGEIIYHEDGRYKLADGVTALSALTFRGAGGTATWGGITGTLSNQTDLQTVLNNKEPLKGSDDNYVTDAQLVVIGNTSGTNTGDETAARIGTIVNGATNYVTPLDADKIGIWDVANSLFKAVTWANLKATLASTFYLDATSSIQTQLYNRTTLLAKNNVQVSHTGTLTETLILSYDLTNLFAANDIIKTNFRVYPNNSVNTKTIRIKVNTSATLTGAQTLGTYAFTSSAANFQKALWFENTLASIKAMFPTSTVINDETSLNNITGLNTITHDFTGPTFFLISAQLTVISDTLYFLNGEILRKR